MTLEKAVNIIKAKLPNLNITNIIPIEEIDLKPVPLKYQNDYAGIIYYNTIKENEFSDGFIWVNKDEKIFRYILNWMQNN